MESSDVDYRGEVTGVVIEANGIRLWMYPDGPSNGGGDQISVSNRVFVSEAGKPFDFDPTDVGAHAAHVVSRLHQPLSVNVQSERDLVVTFGDGHRWTCGPDPRHEAWDLSTKEFHWISTPGGALDFIAGP